MYKVTIPSNTIYESLSLFLDYALNLSILISAGGENNDDFPSNGE